MNHCLARTKWCRGTWDQTGQWARGAKISYLEATLQGNRAKVSRGFLISTHGTGISILKTLTKQKYLLLIPRLQKEIVAEVLFKG